ncbi:nucleoporin-domain-containing protein, partial [Rozella allomycis CSF55]
PKKGVFVKQIEYIMVVATAVEVSVLGIAVSGGDVVFYNTGLSVPTDDVRILSIGASEEGRVFMSGSDGNLYELNYQSKEGWFKRRCSKVVKSRGIISQYASILNPFGSIDALMSVVVDDTRNMVYTLSEKSNVSVYYMGLDGRDFKHLETIDFSFMVYQGKMMVGRNGSVFEGENLQVIGVHGIKRSESERVNFFVCLSNGIRMYFGVDNNMQVKMIHVRIGNEFRMNNLMVSPVLRNSYHLSFYSEGCFLAASGSGIESEDLMWMVCPNSNLLSRGKGGVVKENGSVGIEKSMINNLQGKTWSVCELKNRKEKREENRNNEFLNQFRSKRRRFLVMSNSEKNRPVDLMIKILRESNGKETEQLKIFYESFERDEIACTSLILVSSPFQSFNQEMILSQLESNIKQASLYCLYKYSGIPTLVKNETSSATNTSTTFNPSTSTFNPSTTFNPSFNTISNPLNPYNTSIVYSGLFNGLNLLVGRIIKPLNDKTLKDLSLLNEREDNFVLLQVIKQNMIQIKNFMEESEIVKRYEMENMKSIQFIDAEIEEAIKRELIKMKEIKSFVNYFIEMINLIIILLDFNLKELMKNFNEKILILDLIGKIDLMKELIGNLINKHIKQEINIESLLETLRENCSLYFTTDDYLMYKASESLNKNSIIDSFKLFVKVAKSISINRLKLICEEYKRLKCHQYAIKLILLSLENVELNQIERNEIYEICISLFEGDFKCDKGDKGDRGDKGVRGESSTLTSESMTSVGGQLHSMTSESHDSLLLTCLQIAMKSNDKLFHERLIDYFAFVKKFNLIIQMKSLFVEEVLKNRMNNPKIAEDYDLLWKYYVHNEIFDKASLACYSIATNEE